MSQVLAHALDHTIFVAAVVVMVLAFATTSMQSVVAHRRMKRIAIEDALTGDSAQRLWEHALHEDRQYNERLYFFLVFESVLLGVVGVLYSKMAVANAALLAVAALGLVTTLIWANEQVNHKYYLETFYPRLEKWPEFAQTVAYDRLWKPRSRRRLLSYGVPLAVAIVWLALIALLNGLPY